MTSSHAQALAHGSTFLELRRHRARAFVRRLPLGAWALLYSARTQPGDGKAFSVLRALMDFRGSFGAYPLGSEGQPPNQHTRRRTQLDGLGRQMVRVTTLFFAKMQTVHFT